MTDKQITKKKGFGSFSFLRVVDQSKKASCREMPVALCFVDVDKALLQYTLPPPPSLPKKASSSDSRHLSIRYAERMAVFKSVALSGTPVRVFQSRYTIAIVYRLMFFMYRRVSRYTPLSWVSQDYVRSMLLVSQLKLPSRSYRAIGGIAAILSQIAA